MTDQTQQERIARALWNGRIEREDPDIPDMPWEEAVQTKYVTVAYEVQEIRADADTAIIALLPDRDAFTKALVEITTASYHLGKANSWGKGTAFEERVEQDAINRLNALVYGKETPQ